MRHQKALAFLVLVLAVPLHAIDITLTVTRNAQQEFVVSSNHVQNGQSRTITRELHSVTLTCATGVPCTGINVAIGTTPLCEVQTGNACSGTIQPAHLASSAELIVRRSTTPIFTGTLQPDVPAQQNSNSNSSSSGGTELADLLKTPCENTITAQVNVLESGADTPAESGTYSRKLNTAIFVVDVLGNVLAAPTENVDENDSVTVRVIADTRLHRFLKVRRKSAIRVLTNRNLGAGLTVPGVLAQSGAAEQCGPKDFVLKDFNPGKGEVEIQVQIGTQTQSLGTFEFLVDPLYNGMFSLGTATSDLTDRAFKLRTVGDQKFIYSTEEGDTTKYVVYFTPFLRARDIEKEQRFLQHINPTFGISTQETASNAYAGISLDYKGFVVTGGWHFARINGLASSSGLLEGSVFAGAEGDIPQAKRWDSDTFIGVSIDLRSAVELFQTLVSGGGGGGGGS